MDEFKETEVVIPVDDHLGATTIVATINHPKEGVWAFAQCRGPRWCVVIRTPIQSSTPLPSSTPKLEAEV